MNSVPCVGLLAACLLHVFGCDQPIKGTENFQECCKRSNISNDLCFAV